MRLVSRVWNEGNAQKVSLNWQRRIRLALADLFVKTFSTRQYTSSDGAARRVSHFDPDITDALGSTHTPHSESRMAKVLEMPASHSIECDPNGGGFGAIAPLNMK